MARSPATDNGVRIDQWLHAARFFKTRALAAAAVKAHRVLVAGARVKPARLLVPGDALSIVRGEERFEIIVLGLARRRGSATVAQTLYEETADGRERRLARAEERRLAITTAPRPAKRPDKRSRRHLIRFRRVGAGEDGDAEG